MKNENIYLMEEWKKPRPLPSGVAIPTTSIKDFLFYFMNIDERIWEMTQAQRKTWSLEIIANWEAFRRILYHDGTAEFHKQLKDMHRMGGGALIVPGDMGTGKSIFGMSIGKIWNVLNKSKEPIHIFWSKSDLRAKLRKTPPNTVHIVDEDMKSTGSGSANLGLHLKNKIESIRKTGKLVILIGVNVKPSELGRAIVLQIFPIGFNRKFQANRFIVCNWKGEPLWIAYTQRYYYPTEKAYYEGELGFLGEYADRALEFSNEMSGVFSGTNAEQEMEWSNQLVKHCKSEWKGVKLSMEVLEFLSIQIGIPQESIASIRRVCAYSKLMLNKPEFSKPSKKRIEITQAGWGGFRKALYELSLKKGASERDAEMVSLYHVPKSPKWTYGDVGKEMGLSILPDSVSSVIRARKHEFTTKEIGDIGEKFVLSLVDSLGAEWGGGGSNTPDIKIGEYVFNVKTTLSDNMKSLEPTTPENKWDKSYVLLLIPRLLECRIYKIAGTHTMLNGRKGSLLTIDTLATSLDEFMLVNDNDEEEGGDI